MAVAGQRWSGRASAARPAPTWWRRLLRHEELSLLAILAAVVLFFLAAEPSVRNARTYLDLLRELSPTLIAAVGITLLLIAGELDLSISSMLAVSGVATVETLNRTGNLWLGVLVGLLTGPLVGVLNGLMVTVLGMNSLVTTLGSLFALRGLVYVATNKTPVVAEGGFPEFNWLYQGSIGPLPVPGLLAIGLIALAAFLLRRTEFGRKLYAVGGNPTAARVSGIRVGRLKFALFVLSATMAALSGLLIASQTSTGYFDAGITGFELVVIASVVLGGVSLAGGEGRLVSAMLGVLIIGMTGKGLRLMGLHTTQQLIVTGAVLLVAVYFHRVRKQLLANGRGG
jgi:ribose/xylose/arabinose/galactoside ABC-type transport system permease subunit